MNVLSFSNEHDAGAAIVQNGTIVSAINEERLTRVKNQNGFPALSIDYVLKTSNLKHSEIDQVIIPEISKAQDVFGRVTRFPFTSLSPKLLKQPVHALQNLIYSSYLIGKIYPRVVVEHTRDESRLRKMFPNARFHRLEHHVSHAASAYYPSGFDEAIVITADYWGDFVCSMVAIGRGKELQPVARSYFPNSPGHYYGILTSWLGFTPNRHEGKILGLAAYGDPDSPVYEKIRPLFNAKGLCVDAPNMIGALWNRKLPFKKHSLMQHLIDNYSREDISAAFQRRFEEVFIEIVQNAVKEFKIPNLALAGGSFANVKLNQRLFNVDGIENIFVFPNMSDGGLASGAALQHDVFNNGNTATPIKNAYLGASFSNEEIKAVLDKEEVTYTLEDDIEETVSDLLIEGKVVARFHGAMEYGPRALGNRSILYHTKDKSVNDWLNKRLGRTEFMPFAPVTLTEEAHTCYIGLEGAENTARFMTITFDCTDFMKEKSPAAVHIDGTARPQLVSKEDNPSYHKILRRYFEKTGIPSIINTSYNMHEEPIVCTPYDAVRAFKLGHLEYLAIGDFLVSNLQDS